MKVITLRPNGTRRVTTRNTEPSKTDQQFAKEVDVNHIMANARKGVMTNHVRNSKGVYADVSEIPDLIECMEIMSRAQSDFDALPAPIRARFGNSPVELVDFLNKEENNEEAIKLGFKEIPKKSPLDQALESQNELINELKTKKENPKDKKAKGNDID